MQNILEPTSNTSSMRVLFWRFFVATSILLLSHTRGLATRLNYRRYGDNVISLKKGSLDMHFTGRRLYAVNAEILADFATEDSKVSNSVRDFGDIGMTGHFVLDAKSSCTSWTWSRTRFIGVSRADAWLLWWRIRGLCGPLWRSDQISTFMSRPLNILSAWADFIAGAMMKEKAPAHFVWNDGGGGWRVGKCRVTSGGEKKEEEGFSARTRRFLRQLQTIRESGDDLEQGRI